MADMRRGSLAMGEMPMGWLVVKMAVPLMISMMVQAMYNIVDGIFVSQIGMEAISAVGIAFPVQMVGISISNGLGVGMNALISQRFGRGEGEKAAHAAGNQLTLALIMSAAFLLFGIFGTRSYFEICTNDPLIVEYGTQYLSVVCICAVGHMLAVYGERLLQVTGRTMMSMLTQVVGAIVNIVLDPILIFGWFGAPEMGVRGAAVATVLGLFASAILGLALHHHYDAHLRVRPKDLRLDRDVLEILRVGLPVALTTGLMSLMIFGVNFILKEYVMEVAVFTVYFRLQSFLFMPVQGMMQGLVPVVGYNYGAGKGKRLKKAIALGTWICLGIMIAGMLVLQIVPGPVFGLFAQKSGPEMLEAGVHALRVISLSFPMAGLALVLSNIFQGMGNGVPSVLFGLLRQCVVLLPVLWVLLQTSGPSAIWLSFPIAEAVTAVIIIFVFRKEYRKRVTPLLEAEQETATG